jgi:membrane-associated phospholipid phosphatase
MLIISQLVPKGEPELFINGQHNRLLDFLFYYITETGTGYFYALITAIFLFYKYSIAFTLIIQGLIATIITNVLKHLVFTNSPRPPAFFTDHTSLHFIDGSPIFYTNSFPSGHSITIVLLCASLSYFLPKKYSFILCAWALLVLISRMYLLRHFMIDVSIGGIIGFVISMATTNYLYQFFRKKWGEQSLRNSFIVNR